MVGRPPFKPTAAQRRKVSAAVAGGMTHEQIAKALGITKPTLYKYFADELDAGAAERRMEAIDALFRRAKGGNVAACKAVLLLSAAIAPSPTQGKEKAAPAPREAKLGKKEAAQIAAVGAAQGTEWDGLLPSAGQPLQ